MIVVCSLIGAGMNNRMNFWCVVLVHEGGNFQTTPFQKNSDFSKWFEKSDFSQKSDFLGTLDTHGLKNPIFLSYRIAIHGAIHGAIHSVTIRNPVPSCSQCGLMKIGRTKQKKPVPNDTGFFYGKFLPEQTNCA
jgi:hypothetical protein